jgi:hypothetical protein
VGFITSAIGSLFGGAGSYLGGQSAKSNDLTGYNYLTGQRANKGLGPGVIGYVNTGNKANDQSANLLGLNGPEAASASSPAFYNYLNSTGYGFQLDQGDKAITGSAAARGLLNSGSTAKALQKYGQGLASNYFNDYLNQTNASANRGLTAANMIGQAGTEGGKAAGEAMSNGIGGLFGSIGNIFGDI